jgi:hypothetical protein
VERQPGGPAAHSIVRAGGRRVHLSERQEEEEEHGNNSTVKPVYSDHARSWTSLVVMDRWSLYTGKVYRENARGSKRTSGR